MDECKERETKFALELYKEVGTNWRYWGEMRFKQVAVFVVMFAALVTAATSPTVTRAPLARVAIGVLGAVLSIGLLIVEERATYYRRAYMSCALALEVRNDFEGLGGLYVNRRVYNPWPVRTDLLFRSLFATSTGIWAGYVCFSTSKGDEPWALGTGVAFFLGVLVVGTWGAKRFHWHAERAGFRPFADFSLPPLRHRESLVGFWTVAVTAEERLQTKEQDSQEVISGD